MCFELFMKNKKLNNCANFKILLRSQVQLMLKE